LALKEKIWKATKHREREESTIKKYRMDQKEVEKESIRQYLKTVIEKKSGL
jgi:hypothetical protein